MFRDQLGRMLPSSLKTALYDEYRNMNWFRKRITMRESVVSLKDVRLRANLTLEG